MYLDGLPLHPLVVHIVVVLLPLAAVGTVALALRPPWRRTYGIPVLGLAVLGLAAVPVARISGSALAVTLEHDSPALAAHMARADTVLPAAIGYVVLLAAAVVLDRRAAGPSPGLRVVGATTVLAAVAGIVTAALVVWTGHAGATAVWAS